ncbi:conserved hypothetical protein [Cupriavidus phytorum]|uniref:Uncharacterized protein n=1 Tax=Cupriavidus taiwanensis TaxID=164546 RepID=A0A375C8Y0_9BURK|nr:hypothetical protein [Cupriavidus taiwanensis]SOY65588.1 conserved hypothetical protein [Cupriavidus taiwanensis]
MATEINPLAFAQGWQTSQQMIDGAQENKLRKLLIDQKAREVGQQNALSGIIGNTANYDQNGYLKREALPQIAAAAPGQLPAYQRLMSDQATEQASAQKQKREALIAQFDWADKNMASVRDQAGWDEFRARAAAVYPDIAARLPAQFDPASIQANRMKMVPVIEQLKLEQQQQQFAETQRHNRATEANTLRGQEMTAETTRRGQDLTAAAAAAKPNQEEAKAQTQRVKDANDALGLLDQAEKLVPASTGSYIGAGLDAGMAAFGKSTEGAKAAAQLKAIEGMLVSKMPKMSGPQSDKDVAMYRQMAGTIGDPTIPRDTKLAAIKTIREIQNKYAGNEAAPASPSVPKSSPTDALAELQRRAGSDPALAAKLKAMGY